MESNHCDWLSGKWGELLALNNKQKSLGPSLPAGYLFWACSVEISNISDS